MTLSDDTVVIVCEPDFTIRKEDEDARLELLQALTEESLMWDCRLESLKHHISDPEVLQDFTAKFDQYRQAQQHL